MRHFYNLLFRLYSRMINSIAFHPTLIALGMFLFSLLMISLEYQPWMLAWKKSLRFVLVGDADNARLILGTLVGGIISLTVFSFSMVMLVLNRASSMLSPRVIPGLITQRSHQRTLGFYVGTIIYSLLLMININSPDAPAGRIPELGILISMLFGVACLAMFVYFIDAISRSIQVEAILDDIFRTTRKRLKSRRQKIEQLPGPLQWPKDESWQEISALRAGYFKSLNEESLLRLLKQKNLVASVQVHRGFFVVPGHPLLKVDGSVDQETAKLLLDHFDFFTEEFVQDHYLYGFKQISEIAVKALSPGINDPGTAIKALDLLSVLFSETLGLPEFDAATDDQGEVRLFYLDVGLQPLLFQILTPIRQYGQQDACVMRNYLQALKNVLYVEMDDHQQGLLLACIRSAIESVDAQVPNSLDRQELNRMIGKINAVKSQGPSLPLLSID